jgi:hypothetical protein
MPINLKDLQGALAQVGKIAYDEITFPAGDHEITLRPIKTWEESETDAYAKVAWEGKEDDDAAAFGDYLDRMRVGTLSHAIIVFDGIDLRDVNHLDTGELSSLGAMIQVKKHAALRDAIFEWPRQVLHRAYLKYSEMMTGVELKAQAAIQIEVKDLDAEIVRLNARVLDLKAIKEASEERAEAPEPKAHEREAVAHASKVAEDRMAGLLDQADNAEFRRQATSAEQGAPQAQAQQAPPQAPQSQAQPQAAPQPRGRQEGVSYPPMGGAGQARQPASDPRPGSRRPITPQTGAAPSREEAPQQPAPRPVERDSMGIERPHGGDSFYDSAEPEDAMAAETRRQLEFRREAGLPTQGTIEPPEHQGTPPHAVAHRQQINTENSQMDLKGDAVTTGRIDPRTGEEIAAVRLPTDVVSEDHRGVQTGPSKGDVRTQLNQGGAGSRNPNFVAPGGSPAEAQGKDPKVWRDQR